MFHTQCKIDYSRTLLEYKSYRSFDKRKSEAMFSQQPMLQIDNLYLVGAHYVSARALRSKCPEEEKLTVFCLEGIFKRI
jgi:hypothetical protein